MNPRRMNNPMEGRSLDVDEVRLISDLRIMHAKVDELHHVVVNLKRRHSEAAIHKYSHQQVLAENIQRVDEIYLWFVSLRESSNGGRRAG